MMIKKITYTILLLITSFGYSSAQENVTEQFMKYVTSANHKAVSDLCGSFVEIETDKYEETTSKNQVGFILKDFFATHPPQTFEYSHIGTSPGGAKYAIASYVSTQGKDFLVVVKFKMHGGSLVIDTIKFTPE
jgi:hypothetical protein